jgi:gliding motility-associated-like protein
VVSVLVSPLPVPSFDAVYNSCEPFIVTLTNTTPGISASCVWQISNSSAPIFGCAPITLTIGQAGSYDVTLTTSTPDGCTATITELDAFVFEEAPNASFTPYNTTLTTLNTEVHFENESTGASSYDWTFGDNSANSGLTNPVHTYDENETGNYLVTLIAYSNAGCSDTAYGYIRVEEEIIYYVPNTFTPDNDSYNQFFQPVFTSGYDPFDYTLLIFDRWGEIIFESHDVTKGWDGTYSGNYKVQDGTYTWKIEFKTSINDKRITDIGHVNVLR